MVKEGVKLIVPFILRGTTSSSTVFREFFFFFLFICSFLVDGCSIGITCATVFYAMNIISLLLFWVYYRGCDFVMRILVIGSFIV